MEIQKDINTEVRLLQNLKTRQRTLVQ